jgi:hypothetical protein
MSGHDGDYCHWPRVSTSALGPGTLALGTARRANRRTSEWCPQDIVDEWGAGSFPASDPPANW